MTLLDRRRMLAGAAFAGASALGLPAWAAGAAAWRAYDARLRQRLADGRFEAEFARALLGLNNALRQTQGLAAYRWDEGLAAAARAHAADMAARDFFEHDSPEGFTPFDRASLLARDVCGPVAENVAWRSGARTPTPRQFMDLWETSPGHRANLLRASYAHAGYGVARVRDRYYAAGVHAHVQVRLAAPLPLRVSSGAQLVAALAGQAERLAVTAPDERPRDAGTPSGVAPALSPGVWQLRPMKATSARRYEILSGPVFFVDPA